MTEKRYPVDMAASELSKIAAELHADANRPPGERKFLGISSPRWIRAAAEALDVLAVGDDPRKLFDGRQKETPRLRAVEAVVDAIGRGALGRTQAIAMAAEQLGLSTRIVRKHLDEDDAIRGASLVFPKRRAPRTKQ